MKNLEIKTEGPCCKLEGGILNSPSQFGSWENLNFSFEDKENHENCYQISPGIIITQNEL